MPSPDRLPAAERLLDDLAGAADDRAHPWRTPVLASLDADGAPTARTVVLRAASAAERSLSLYTDLRSQKVAGLRSDGRVAWCFWDPRARVQLRATGGCRLHAGDDITEQAWSELPVHTRQTWALGAGPGTPLATPGDGRDPARTGRSAFCVVRTIVTSLDWLWLHPAGHRRARWRWAGGRWAGGFVVP